MISERELVLLELAQWAIDLHNDYMEDASCDPDYRNLLKDLLTRAGIAYTIDAKNRIVITKD